MSHLILSRQRLSAPSIRDLLRAAGTLAVLLVVLTVSLACTPAVGQNGAVDVRIASSEPFTWDPAYAGDAGTASVLAQVFEGLTAFDAQSNVQPALAASWRADDDGRRMTFELRPGLTYSDGTPIAGQDVVDSWLRLIDPERPSPLASLLADVEGAVDYQAGRIGPEGVGFRATGEEVIVELRRPAAYFLAVTASPSLAVVPPQMLGRLDDAPPTIVSGAYQPSIRNLGEIHLAANDHYWAGVAPLAEIDLVTDFDGRSGVDLFINGEVDFTGIGTADASWIKYDRGLGPQLRSTDSFSVTYYGFDTAAEPFDDAQVRLAFATAVDWRRMVDLADGVPATSMVPVGVPGRDEDDHVPAYDPDAARDLLAAAGYRGGAGFPPVTLATYGVGFEQTVADQLELNLGVSVQVEAREFQDYLEQVSTSTQPQMWTLAWIADYPHAHDFLGLLLESGSGSNVGGWSNADYDALIEQAAATADPDEQATFYARAQEILEQQAPVVPVAYGESWALSRDGLLGALESGVGLIRYAGLDWAPGAGR